MGGKNKYYWVVKTNPLAYLVARAFAIPLASPTAFALPIATAHLVETIEHAQAAIILAPHLISQPKNSTRLTLWAKVVLWTAHFQFVHTKPFPQW